ncbi:MAG: Bcr/CflA family efflux MFS transporter [Pseudomonadota bacterium]
MIVPRYFIFVVAALIALGPFAIDTYLPALPAIAVDLSVDIVAVNLTVSVYLFGFALGQIIGGPISDQIGRQPVGLIGLGVFALTSLAIAWAETIDLLLALRLLQAIGGGFATVICMAMVRDAYPPDRAAQQFPKVMLVMLGAPLVAPAIGAALLYLGWNAIFIFLSVYGLVMIAALRTVPETAQHRSGQLRPEQILPQYMRVLHSRVDGKLIGLRWIFAQGMMSSLLFVFLTNSPFIYLEYYGVSPNLFVFFFAANVLAMMCGSSLAT